MGIYKIVTPSGVLIGNTATTTAGSSTTETTLVSQVLPGGLMNLYNRLRFTLVCAMSTATTLPGTITIRIKYGSATLVLTGAALTLLANVSNQPFTISGRLRNKGAANSQVLFAELRQGGSSISLAAGIAQGIATTAMESTADQVFAITAQFSNGSAANILIVQDIDMEVN